MAALFLLRGIHTDAAIGSAMGIIKLWHEWETGEFDERNRMRMNFDLKRERMVIDSAIIGKMS